MPDSELWGVWGGAIGGWCWIGRTETGNPYCGTKPQAEETLVVMKKEHPDLPYEVVPFDEHRDPPAKKGKVSELQYTLLQRIKACSSAEGLAENPVARGGFAKATYWAVLEKGLVKYRPTARGRLVLTKAGEQVLATQRPGLRR